MNMKKTLTKLCGLIGFFVVKAQAVSGIYVSLDGGWAHQTGLPSVELVNATSMSQSQEPNAYRGGIGYNHDFTRYFGMGVEVGAGRFGQATYQFADTEEMTIASDTMEFLASFLFHIRQFDLFTKVGGTRLTPSISGADAAVGGTIINPSFIFGGAYNLQATPACPLLRHFAVTLSYETILKSDEHDIKEPNGLWGVSTAFDAVLLGIRYTFGP